MSVFRRPRTQNERKADAGLEAEENDAPVRIKSRKRGAKKAGLPNDRDDIMPAADKDRSRSKPKRTK